MRANPSSASINFASHARCSGVRLTADALEGREFLVGESHSPSAARREFLFRNLHFRRFPHIEPHIEVLFDRPTVPRRMLNLHQI